MNLNKVPVKPRYFDHPLYHANLPESIDTEELGTWISKIKNGDSSAREHLILSYVRYALSIVGKYVSRLGHSYSDEMVSAALQAITEVVNGVASGKIEMYDTNLSGKIGITIHSYVSRVIESSPLIRIPGSTKRTWKQQGKEIRNAPKCYAIYQNDTKHESNVIDSEIDSILHQGWWKSKAVMPCDSEFELRELLNGVLESDLERRIVELRQPFSNNKPMSDQDISEELGISKSSVYLIRLRIAERLKKELNQ